VTRALRDLPCSGVPTAERRTTALGCPIAIALSDTLFPSLPVCPSTSDACVQPNAEANPLPSFQHRRRHDLPMENATDRSDPSRATVEHAHLFEHPKLMIHAQMRRSATRTAAVACAVQLSRARRGAGLRRPARKGARPRNSAQFRPRERGSCRLRFDLGVWTRGAGLAGRRDYKAHVQVS